ncbi:MAG: VCBS repeat-containing protein [Planctomycetes bacterium]|nr:VCBS repeat-containing protein [Planctomycetota bacterium]
MKTSAFLAAASLLAAAAAAQQFDAAIPRDVLGQKPFRTLTAPSAGDVDGDGAVDLVFQGPFVLLQRGSRFVELPGAGVAPNPQLLNATALFDADGDGDLDLVQLQAAGPELFLNDGTGGMLAAVGHMPAVFGFGGIAPADVDGDGDIDLLMAPARLLLNDGTGRFQDASSQIVSTFPFGIGTSIVVADFDVDGDLDFVNMDGLHRNDGYGFFTVDPRAQVVFGYGDSIFASDVDGDGDLDLLGSSGQVLRNSGGGFFHFEILFPAPMLNDWRTEEVADLDGDGDDDLVLTPSFHGLTQLPSWAENDGAGNFAFANLHELPTRHDVVRPLVADLDGDRDEDLLLVPNSTYVPGIAEVLYNLGDGSFHNATDDGGLANGRWFGRTVLDVDGDGDEDVVADALYRNDGLGSFGREIFASSTFPGNVGVTADFDGDGDLDLVGGQALWFNDGSGTFAAGALFVPQNWRIGHAAAADFDRDGDLDLVVYGGVYGQQPEMRALRNDGQGNLTPWAAAIAGIAMPAWPYYGGGLVALDVEGDGDEDLFFGAVGAVPFRSGRLLQNDGTGHFVEVPCVGVFGTGVVDIEVGDFDGDGDPDIRGAGELLVNDGTGGFSVSALGLAVAVAHVIRADDVDGDGDLDLWAALAAPNRVELFVNDGSNQFTADPARVDPGQVLDPIVELMLIDVDRDGDRDLVAYAQVSGSGQPQYPIVYRNHTHQLRAPYPGRTGGALELSVAAIGAPTAPSAVAMAVTVGRAVVPMGPLGILGLDLSAPPLWSGFLPMNGANLTVSLPVPGVAELQGLTVFAQALFLAPGDVRLSATVSGTILH